MTRSDYVKCLLASAAALSLILVGCPGGGDDDDDAATPTATPTQATPTQTPEEATPTKTPEPTPTAVPEKTPDPTVTLLEDNQYYLIGLVSFDLSGYTAENGGYGYAAVAGYMTTSDDGITEGYQEWRFWVTKEDASTSSPACVMPEDFIGVRNDSKYDTKKCPDCLSVWDITFTPSQTLTTCPETTLKWWNCDAADTSCTGYEDWPDAWGFDPTANGYPSALKDLKADLDALGTEYIGLAESFASRGVWGIEYAVADYETYCTQKPTAKLCQSK